MEPKTDNSSQDQINPGQQSSLTHQHADSKDHHGHAHGHSHSHMPGLEKINTAFIVGIGLNTAFLIIEFIVGYLQDSLSLISDAGHNATDVFSLLISLFAFKMMQAKASRKYTYGYKKGTILASLLNALLLFVTVFFIFYEAIARIGKPVAIHGNVVSLVALVGVLINGFSAYLFFKDQKQDINIKGAYLHMVGDAIVSVGVVIGGLLMNYTGWYWIDTVLSIIIGLIILKATWGLFSQSIHLALDGMPEDIDVDQVKAIILTYPDIKSVHHIHIWPLSSNENALTAHLVLSGTDLIRYESIKQELRHDLLHANIHHVTFELESTSCGETVCADEKPHTHD
ncbi:cation diffusion facilitator family transporter [Arachidicoccus rhizosphaerae]|nr:cation diffusion facilitator family transporter [Arachidicoccus rhizosphaerae]